MDKVTLNFENWWQKPCRLSPSLICLDLCNLESEIRVLEQSGIGQIHVDILDGHFSPSMPLGLDTVRQLRAKTDLSSLNCVLALQMVCKRLAHLGIKAHCVGEITEPAI